LDPLIKRLLSQWFASVLHRPLASHQYFPFPCRADKRPACAHGFKHATDDADELKELWRQFPGPLVGVACGPSYIAVLDLDAKHEEAQAFWAKHRSELLPTRVHRTRSGGLHLIYGDCDGIKCSAGKIAKGVDVRGAGGYIVWWPAAGQPVLHEGPCGPWPEWLLKPAIKPSAPLPRQPYVGSGSHLQTRLVGLAEFVAHSPKGQRNSRLYWAARRGADMIRNREISEPLAHQLLSTLHTAAVNAGFEHAGAERTIRSALRGSTA
jgi:hypothetical protein